MNTTKRKFQSLIQRLGSRKGNSPLDSSNPKGDPSSDISLDANDTPSPASTSTTKDSLPSASSSTSQFASLTKRRRINLAKGDSIYRLPAPTTGKASAPRQPNQWSGQASNAKPPAPAARYCPADRDELIKRLASFQEIAYWTPKPDRVNEFEWARRGWISHGKETVRCVLCSKELVVKLTRETDGKATPIRIPSEIEDALIEKYRDLIVDAHREDCPWRQSGCAASLLRLSFTDYPSVLTSLRSRYDELCVRQPFLPYEFNLRLPVDLQIEHVIALLPESFFTTPAPPAEVKDRGTPNRTALALALLGWQGLFNTKIGAVPNSASCHTCLRRLGLWMFKSKEVNSAGEVVVPAAMDYLDAVKEHRFFCPWRNADAQRFASNNSNNNNNKSTVEEFPAWKLLIQLLRNEAYVTSTLQGRQPLDPLSNTASQSSARLPPNANPSTPTKTKRSLDSAPGTPVAASDRDDTDGDEEAIRTKDKERRDRLRRVKSLFDGRRSSRKSLSRPNTAKSTVEQ